MMLLLTIVSQFSSAAMFRVFSLHPAVIAFGSDYLRIVSFNFVAAGIVFTTSSAFQGIGNTWPPLLSSMTRLFLFVLPAALIARTPRFEIKHVWYLSVASIVLQACINLFLLRNELRKKLTFEGLDDLVPGDATAA